MNNFQDMFDRQKRHFASGVTRTRAWRIEQLDRMGRLVSENEAALQQAIAKDFKTASQEQTFETLACVGEVAFQILRPGAPGRRVGRPGGSRGPPSSRCQTAGRPGSEEAVAIPVSHPHLAGQRPLKDS